MNVNMDKVKELQEACNGITRKGGPSNFVRMFKPRFAPMVWDGKKRQTIRPLPARIPRVGDTLSLRTWIGKPYRSKQRILREAIIKEVNICYIEDDELFMRPRSGSLLQIGGAQIICLKGADADRFARADGFVDWAEMRDWFKAEHGLPFEGIVLFW